MCTAETVGNSELAPVVMVPEREQRGRNCAAYLLIKRITLRVCWLPEATPANADVLLFPLAMQLCITCVFVTDEAHRER